MADDSSFPTLHLSRPGEKRRHSSLTHPSNEDRVLVRTFKPEETRRDTGAVLVAVADGVSRCADGGAVAEWLLQEHIANDTIFQEDANRELASQFHDYLTRLHKQYLSEFRKDYAMLESGCTLAVALVSGNRANAFWSGDSPVHILRPKGDRWAGRTMTIADKDPFTGALTDCFSGVTPFAIKRAGAEVRTGDVIMAVSDGVVQDADDLAQGVDENGFTEAWIESIYQKSFARPFSDDISIAAVHLKPAAE